MLLTQAFQLLAPITPSSACLHYGEVNGHWESLVDLAGAMTPEEAARPAKGSFFAIRPCDYLWLTYLSSQAQVRRASKARWGCQPFTFLLTTTLRGV